MNEAETRAEHVDPALKAAGWGVVEGSRVLREYPITLGRIEGHGRRGIPLTADYVLVYRNHKLAVIEAKAWGSNWRDNLDYFAPAVQLGLTRSNCALSAARPIPESSFCVAWRKKDSAASKWPKCRK
jgi:hypothetical protein